MNADWFQLAILYLPLGIIGLVRWSLWLLKRLGGFFYLPDRTPGPTDSVSVITPVYLEDPDTFEAALESWLANRPREVIAVIDQADQDCIALFQRRAARPSDVALKLLVTAVPGKRPALALGIRAAEGDIVALVDSDTLWEPGCLPRLTAPLRHPEVGGVTCRQRVLHGDTLSRKLTGLIFALRYADELPFLAVAGHGFSCLSGRTAIYRKSAVTPCLDEMVNETFWGRPCISGEDKRLTYLMQARGHQTRYQGNATVYTVPPPSLTALIKQKVRWSRNSWRSDLRALGQGWVWRRPVLAYYLIDKTVSTFTILISPMFLGLSIYLNHWPIAIAIPVWWLVSRAVKALPYLQQQPRQLWIVPVYVLFGFFQGVLKIYALVTLNRQGWLTRQRVAPSPKTLSRLVASSGAYAATGLVLALLFFGVFSYYQATR